VATLLVAIHVNDQQADAKQQSLVFTVKVKPVVYALMRLRRITKSADLGSRGKWAVGFSLFHLTTLSSLSWAFVLF
jgi:hypothetical protein